jgi:hypothetical protein
MFCPIGSFLSGPTPIANIAPSSTPELGSVQIGPIAHQSSVLSPGQGDEALSPVNRTGRKQFGTPGEVFMKSCKIAKSKLESLQCVIQR